MNAERITQLQDEGARRFCRWDPRVFDAVVAGPAQILAGRLGDQNDAAAVLAGYLHLVQQAVGEGLLTQAAAGPAGWSNFLERLLIEGVPAQLPEMPAARRLALLADTWNLGEGLLREPAWVDRYVNACAKALPRLDKLEAFLVRTLKPVLLPTTPSTWTGAFRATVVDLRPIHDDFLPGPLGLVAPRVVQVEDRRKKDRHAAVLLQSGQKSELLGVLSGLVEYREAGEVPRVEFGDGRAQIGSSRVELPSLRRCHAFAVARCGFIAACAVDSQRLWVIECE